MTLKHVDIEDLAVHPVLERLAEAAKQGPLLEITGLVGPSDEHVVRLHSALGTRTDTYTEIDKHDVICVLADAESGRTTLYIPADTDVRRVGSATSPGPTPPSMDLRSSIEIACGRLGRLVGTYDQVLRMPMSEELRSLVEQARADAEKVRGYLRCDELHYGPHWH